MKIAIIGNSGSGKSTLAFQLHKILHLPLFHLDQYFWKPGWQRPNRDEFAKIHNNLCDGNAWIIEGMAIRLYVRNFNTKQKPEIERLLEQYKNQKKIFIITNRQELHQLIRDLTT